MIDKKWECQSPDGRSLTIEMPCGGCILWTSLLGSHECASAIVHCSVFTDWGTVLGFRGFSWERFPADSNERGMYYYLISERGKRKILKVVDKLCARGMLLPLESGPAVLDFPIMCVEAVDDSVGLQYYMSNLRHNKFDDIDIQDMHKMYEVGYAQFKLLPAELLAEIPWYEVQICDEYAIHQRLLEQCIPK